MTKKAKAKFWKVWSTAALNGIYCIVEAETLDTAKKIAEKKYGVIGVVFQVTTDKDGFQ